MLRPPLGYPGRRHVAVRAGIPSGGILLFSAIARVFRTPDLRRKIAFTLAIIALYRFGAHSPAPFVDFPNVQEVIAQSHLTTYVVSASP